MVYGHRYHVACKWPRGAMAMGTVPESELSESDLQQEHEHFQKIVNAFLYYRPHALSRVDRFATNYQSLPVHHRKMLPGMPSHIEALKTAVDINQSFVEKIVTSAVGMFENSQVSQLDAGMTVTPATSFDMEKVRTTIKQFFRDWSEEGASERNLCYKPIINEIIRRYPPDTIDPGTVSILVPGAGLGRLAFELAQRGYTCQGNEFSMYMLLASNFILNQTNGVKAFTICPWIHQFSNMWSYDNQLAKVSIPDVDPSDLPTFGLFSMAAGDFLEVYTTPDEWDCVACCFFIDTAHNVIHYLEKIYHILKPGGIWINFGPLLYHFADMPGEPSIELSWQDIRRIAEEEIGFEIIREDRDLPSPYIQNPHSMFKMTYSCVFLVARKPTTASHDHGASSTQARADHDIGNHPLLTEPVQTVANTLQPQSQIRSVTGTPSTTQS